MNSTYRKWTALNLRCGLGALWLWAAMTTATAAPAATETAAAQGPLSIDEAIEPRTFWGARLAPSGQRVAGILARHDGQYVLISDTAAANAAVNGRKFEGAQLLWLEWLNDNRLLVAVRVWLDDQLRPIPAGALKLSQSAIPTTRLYSMDASGNDLVMLLTGADQFRNYVNLSRITAFAGDGEHVYMSLPYNQDLDLFKVNVVSGGHERVALGTSRTYGWVVGSDGQPAFRLDYSDFRNEASIHARRHDADAASASVPIKPDQWQKIRSIRLPSDNDAGSMDFEVLAAAPDPLQFYVLGRNEGQDTAGIQLFDLRNLTMAQTLIAEPDVDMTDIVVDRASRAILGSISYRDRQLTRLLDPQLQARFDAAERFFAHEVDLDLIDRSGDGQIWLLHAQGPQNRGSYHVYNLKINQIHRVADSYPALDARRLGQTQVIHYQASDGTQLMGYLTRPPGSRPEQRPPLIVMPHGGPEIRDYRHFNSLSQFLASRGYQVFQPNFRGSSGFGRKFAEAGYGHWHDVIAGDIRDGFDHLVRVGLADPQQACIVGGSFGGYAALQAMTSDPRRYRCAVSYAGVADLVDQLKFDRAQMGSSSPSWAYVQRQIGTLGQDRAQLEARSPIAQAAAVQGPILLIHGALDRVVPIRQSMDMAKALTRHQKANEFLRLEDSAHGPGSDADHRLKLTTIERFLRAQLPIAADKAATEPVPPAAPAS